MGNKITIKVKSIAIVLLIVLVYYLIIKDWTNCVIICLAMGAFTLFVRWENKRLKNLTLYPEDLSILKDYQKSGVYKTFLFSMVGPIERLKKKIELYKEMVEISKGCDSEVEVILEFREKQLMDAYVGCLGTYLALLESKLIKTEKELLPIKKRLLESFIEIRSYDGFLINKMDNPEILNPNKILKELEISLKRLEEIEKSLNNK